MLDSNDLLRKIAHATGGIIGKGTESEYEYSSGYSGRSAGAAIGGTIGAHVGDKVIAVVRANQPLLSVAVLAAIGSLAAALMARALANLLNSPQGTAVAYVAFVSVSGVVSAVALNILNQPIAVQEVMVE